MSNNTMSPMYSPTQWGEVSSPYSAGDGDRSAGPCCTENISVRMAEISIIAAGIALTVLSAPGGSDGWLSKILNGSRQMYFGFGMTAAGVGMGVINVIHYVTSSICASDDNSPRECCCSEGFTIRASEILLLGTGLTLVGLSVRDAKGEGWLELLTNLTRMGYLGAGMILGWAGIETIRDVHSVAASVFGAARSSMRNDYQYIRV